MQNSSSLASLIEVKGLVLSYITTTSLSRALKWQELGFKFSKGYIERYTNVSVTSSKACQACHAVFLPLNLNAEIVSQPVMAWNTGRALDLGSPRLSQIAFMCKNL